MNRERIAIDVDEVLFPFVANFCDFHNDKYQTSLHPDQFHSYEFQHVLDATFEETVERVYEFNEADHRHISPIEEVETAIDLLSQDYDLDIVTARHPKFEATTKNWILQHFGEKFSEIVHIGYFAVMEKPRLKVDVCRDLGAIALVDDSIGHVAQCAERGIDGILFGNYSWNRAQTLPDGVVRCASWSEVVAYFNER